jgi:hypothetical protein
MSEIAAMPDKPDNSALARKPATSRLLCLALATVGLLLISIAIHDGDATAVPPAPSPELARPTLTRLIAQATLQAQGPDATSPTHNRPARLGAADAPVGGM